VFQWGGVSPPPPPPRNHLAPAKLHLNACMHALFKVFFVQFFLCRSSFPFSFVLFAAYSSRRSPFTGQQAYLGVM